MSDAGLVATSTYDGFHGNALAALIGAVLAAVACLAFLLVRWFQWVPRLPRAGPETSELGPEPPAVANLLVNAWYVTAAAVPATLVDLAARRVVGLEEVGPDHFVVRTRSHTGASDLTAYEHQVLAFVEQRATGGSAPVEVLGLGTDEGEGWLARFSGAVVEDAESRGLARRGWQRGELVALGGTLAVALGLLALALTLAHVGAGGRSGRAGDHEGAWFVLAGIAWVAAISVGARLRTVRATPAGRAACARWLGVREHLRRDESFVEQPPAAVAIWGRLLAYGVALGANRAAIAALPIGPDDPDHAWSRESGSWRRLRVRYPRRFGAGEPPRKVLVNGLGQLLLWGVVAAFALRVLSTVLWDATHEAFEHDGDLAILGLVLLFLAVPTVGLVYVCARLVGAAIRVGRGAHDLRHTQSVEGRVVKVVRGSFAVDDGRSDELVAMRAPPADSPQLGERVRVTYTPALHHVEEVIALPTSPTKEQTDGIVQATAADVDVER